MMKLILGMFIGAGIVFTVLALIEKEEQKKINDYEIWRRRYDNSNDYSDQCGDRSNH